MNLMKLVFAILIPFSALAAPTGSEAVKDEEPLEVQNDLRPPVQKITQQALENKVRDNLFKKEEEKEKEQAKKE